MMEENKLNVFYENHIFDKKDIYEGLELIESRRTRGKLVYEIFKD